MKINQLTSIAFLIFVSFVGNAQEYFQQEVNYKINVRLDDIKHELFADATIEYINNSPNTLEYIYFHLWPNGYKGKQTPYVKEKIENGQSWVYYQIETENKAYSGYIDSLHFKVNGNDIKWEYDPETDEICKLILNQPLKSGEKIVISTPFHVKLPHTWVRLGHNGQAYQLAQWYPKPAVYDKFGWHQFAYADNVEYYSEFGSFDVSITLPKNYVVAATGNLQNEEEIAWLNQKSAETDTIKMFDANDMKTPVSSSEMKTLRYIERNIHDFAICADKRYHVRKTEIELPVSKRKVTIWTFFNNRKASLWTNANEYIKEAIINFSKWYGEYPYNNVSAVSTVGRSMEYPQLTMVSVSGPEYKFCETIFHEIGHNWAYGILGFNEHDYSFQDEGLATFGTMRYTSQKHPNLTLSQYLGDKKIFEFANLDDYSSRAYIDLFLNEVTKKNLDQPLNTPALKYTFINTGAMAYFKSAYSFNYLMNYLGENEFDAIMQKFYNQWKFKHPYPEDLRKCFEENTNKDLNWFFDDLLTTTKKVDYKMSKVKGNKVFVYNNGDINSPVSITGFNNKGEIIFSEWHDGFSGTKSFEFPNSNVKTLKLDYNNTFCEVNRNNNSIRTTGLFKKTNPLEIRMIQAFEKPNKTQLGIFPAMGWNYYNNLMLGALFYNKILYYNWEYQLVPMFSFGTNNFAGSGHIAYHYYPQNSIFQNITFRVSALQYAYKSQKSANFQKFSGTIDFQIKNRNDRSKQELHLLLNSNYASNIEDILLEKPLSSSVFYNMDINFADNRIIDPYSISVKTQAHNTFVKSQIEANYKINYQSDKKGLELRLFAGTFLSKSDNLSDIYSYSLSGTSGSNDYQFNNTFLGRFEDVKNHSQLDFFSHQFVKNQGGFSIYSPYIQSNNWMVSLNISTTIPKIPLKLYGSFATYEGAGKLEWESSSSKTIKSKLVAWEAGIEIPLMKFASIYFPLFVSDDLNEINKQFADNYFQRIRFAINFNELNIFKIREKAVDLMSK
jgi:hypothetical protein